MPLPGTENPAVSRTVREAYLVLTGKSLLSLEKDLGSLAVLLGECPDPGFLGELKLVMDQACHYRGRIKASLPKEIGKDAGFLHGFETLLGDSPRLEAACSGLSPWDQATARSQVRHLKGHLKTIGQLLWRWRLEAELESLVQSLSDEEQLLRRVFGEASDPAQTKERIAEILRLLGR